MALVFARNADGSLASLAKELDKAAAANDKLTAVVNFIGVDAEAIAAFAQEHGIKHVALTSTDEDNAKRFKISPEAEVTVMHYRDKKVMANHAVAKGKLDGKAVAAIVASTAKVLAEES